MSLEVTDGPKARWWETHEAYRLERAARFVLGAIGPLVISFAYKFPLGGVGGPVQAGNSFPIGYSFLLAIFYCLFAALAPPQLSALPILGGGALVGIILGVSLAIACFSVAVAHGKACALLLLGAGIFVVSPLKTGSTQAITFLICSCCVYSAAITFILAIPFADEGIFLQLPFSDLGSTYQEFHDSPQWRQVLPETLWKDTLDLVVNLIKACGANDGSNATLAAVCHQHLVVPSGYLEGIAFDLTVEKGFVTFALNPGMRTLELIWSGPMAVITPMIELFFIAIFFYAGSLLIPLPRVRTSFYVTRKEIAGMINGPLVSALNAVHASIDSKGDSIEAAYDAVKEIEGRALPALVSAKTSTFEPSWPPMGVPLLRIMPALVSTTLEGAQSTLALARHASEADHEERQLTKEVLQRVRLLMLETSNFLAKMPPTAETVVKARLEATRICDTIHDSNEMGMLLKHGVLRDALELANSAIELCDLRARSSASLAGFLRGVGLMLAGILIPAGLPFYRIVQPVVMCVKGRRLGGGIDWFDLRIQVGLTLGLMLLVLPSLYSTFWAEIGVDMKVFKEVGMRGNFSFWAVLGFIVAYTPTLEGALYRSTMRALGTFAAAVTAYVGVTICGPTNHAALIVWLLTTYALAVVIGANPRHPLHGFNQSWGYAAQLFTYTQTIIVVESSVGIGGVGTLALARLCAQLIGILTALLMSLLVWVRTRRAAKERIAQAFEILASVVNRLAVEGSEVSSGCCSASAEQLLMAVDEKLDHAQAALDDAKVDYRPKRSQWILGPGTVGMKECRQITAYCRRVLGLVRERDMKPSEPALTAAHVALQEAAERLRAAAAGPEVRPAPVPAASEVDWLLARIACAAKRAGAAEVERSVRCGELSVATV